MSRRANGEFYVKLCDFGFSTLFASEQISPVDLPISTPWHAPGLDDTQFGLSVLEAKRADIYSVGLVCLWLVFGKGVAKPADNLWARGYGFLRELKRDMGISSFVALNLQELSDVDEEMKSVGRLDEYA